MKRLALAAVLVCMLVCPTAVAQQPVQLPPAAQPVPLGQQAPALQAPPGFELNALQLAELNQVLATWQAKSREIKTFKCAFERWDYNAAFGPGPNIPLNKDKGELSYGKPDKGSFQITEVNTWQAKPVPPGQNPAQIQGDWVRQPDAIGEHWVCDGKSVFEYRHNQKQLVERPIPPHLQGQAIADGPLPFLFGANPNKLHARYWMRVEQSPDPNQIWLLALPKFQAQAADFKAVEVILDRQRMLPSHMRVTLPNGGRHLYIFDVAGASMNSPLDRLQNMFQLPRLPLGWKRIVEPAAVQQAAQPVAAPR